MNSLPLEGYIPSASPSDLWLSILVPVYNLEQYLGECLTSIQQQLVPGIEIIVVDDASTDSSAAVLRRFEDVIGPALRVVTLSNNTGLAAARNRLLREAHGDYCWFVDGDDMMSAGAIRLLHGVIESAPVDLVMCDFRVVREHFRLKHRFRGELHRRTFAGPSWQPSSDRAALIGGILTAGQLHSWSKIARRTIWQSVHFPEGRYFEDMAVFPQLVRLVNSHMYVPEAWIGYRQRGGSILSDMTPVKIRDQLRALGELAPILGDPMTNPVGEQDFALQNFILRSHASLARRVVDDSTTEGAALRSEVCESLLRLMPDGPDATLLAYRRRGWFLRSWRARRSLRRIGLWTRMRQ